MSERKPKIVFIGRKYHAKTKSDHLILSLLQEQYEVVIIRRDDTSDREIVRKVNEADPIAVFFWCLPPSFTFHLRKFKCKNIIWAPMWDGFKPIVFKKMIMYRYYKVKVLCFSQVLHHYFQQTKLKNHFVQCFLKPNLKSYPQHTGPYTVFLWQRDPDIGINQVARMFEKGQIKKLIYKSEIGDQPCDKQDFEIQKMNHWLDKEEYSQLIRECDFFVAPRKAEGIGFSFLEPMSQGVPVIGYNNATMNEYILDGVNGYLFDDQAQLTQPVQAPHRLSHAIEQKAHAFYEKWLEAKQSIYPFIEAKV